MQSNSYTTAIIKKIINEDMFEIFINNCNETAKRCCSLLLTPCQGDLVQCIRCKNNIILIIAILKPAKTEQTTRLILHPYAGMHCKQHLQITADKIKLTAQNLIRGADLLKESAQLQIEKNASQIKIMSSTTEIETGQMNTESDYLNEKTDNLAIRHTGSNEHTVDKMGTANVGRHKIYSEEETVIRGKKVNLN
jgi:hypothetical protein